MDELCEPCTLYDVVVTQLVEVACDNDVRKQKVVTDFGGAALDVDEQVGCSVAYTGVRTKRVVQRGHEHSGADAHP